MFLEALIFSLFFELSYMPDGNLTLYEGYCNETTILHDTNSLNVKSGIEIELYGFHVGGNTEINIIKNDFQIDFNFFPEALGSNFFGYYKNNMLEIGLRHYCLHPIIPYKHSWKDYFFNYEGAFTEIYLKIEIKQKI